MFFSILASYGLALCALGAQAAPAPAPAPDAKSILDAVGNNPKVLASGEVITTYTLPEPNKDDSYDLDGITFYRYPEGTDVDPAFWEEHSVSFPNATKYVRCQIDKAAQAKKLIFLL